MAKYIQGIFIALFLFVSGNIAAQNNYYVTFDGNAIDGGWQDVTTLETAINAAKADDQIWIQGYDGASIDKVYVVPKDGYTIKSGVRIYGGFKGTETSLTQRETVDGKQYRMKYRTVLTGDIDRNDETTGTDFIFPAGDDNNRRTDNATHVLTLDMKPTEASGNNNNSPTIVSGLTIARGHAIGDASGGGNVGGGIYVNGDNTGGGVFKIEQCFFLGNYAAQGGAIYVGADVKNVAGGLNMIDRCAFFNNAAGDRNDPKNNGAGMYICGQAVVVNSVIFNNANGGINANESGKTSGTSDVVVVNSTVTRNSGTGIDGANAGVYNTVVWGNTALAADSDRPTFKHSAYPEASGTGTDSDGNIYLSAKNNDKEGPMFASPSLKTGYDSDFIVYNTIYPEWDWAPQDETTLVDKGYDPHYVGSSLGNYDMAGKKRINGISIDIGAYEYQPVAGDRIRYVKENGTGDGTSWDNASGNLQGMIDDLADGSGQAGEVWIAKGTYAVSAYLDASHNYTASFKMRDNISVYGGFAGTETKKSDRTKGNSGMPWDFANETILEGSGYSSTSPSYSNNSWSMSSNSCHVVWFAPLDNEAAFSEATYLDGVTVRGGQASGTSDEGYPFATDRGAGIYMADGNARVMNCIIKENYAGSVTNVNGMGGGIYMKEGWVRGSLIYNNGATGDGGGIYADEAALIHRSMLANNSAANGGGAFLNAAVDADGKAVNPEYLIMSTCVVSNNTSRTNGAVYCNKGGVLLQNTITNNFCPTAINVTDKDASQTGGLYINEYGLLINSVLWNNRSGSNTPTGGENIPMYAKNPDPAAVRFMYNAMSGVSNAIWNSTLQQQTTSLADGNTSATGSGIVPSFSTDATNSNMASDDDLEKKIGVQDDWKAINYYWKPLTGSALWSTGLEIGLFPDEVLLQPEIDIQGTLYSQKPTVGAFHADNTELAYSEDEDGLLVLYVDADNQATDADGSSWDKAYRSLNGAVSYLAGLSADVVNNRELEVRVLEGDLWPRYAYVNEDVKTATLDLAKSSTTTTLRIKGGYYRDETTGNVERDPLNHRSILNGNREGRNIEDGNYHVITVEDGAKVEIDGFHIINGYAAGSGQILYGAGLLAHTGADVTLLNCVFENNTAVTGAAIGAPEATVKMYNCVVNNNTNTTDTEQIISAQSLTMEHVTVVNNSGAAPTDMGTSSFSAGNTSNNSLTLATIGADGAKNFANPTKTAGATMGFDTYLGGYSEFRPLTSSADAANSIINQATYPSDQGGLPTDITVFNDRDLGGLPDLGAYEADLPKSGRVYYVRTEADGGNDDNDGLSWGKAFATIRKAVNTAYSGEVVDGEKPQVWVAAGTYSQSVEDSKTCFIIREGVNVYGAFPKTGNPGVNDRHPLVSSAVYHDATYSDSDYETILQPSATSGDRRVIGQTDAYNPSGGNSNFTTETTWDGFTITNGSLEGNNNASRSGGGGARIFKNVVLKNCVVTGNSNSTTSTASWANARGGGVYCDQGSIVNCYLINNRMVEPNQVGAYYGGGAYIYNGTMYNCVVANNYIYARFADGAGLFLETANFYNNTVVNNTAENSYDTTNSNTSCRTSGGIGIWSGGTLNLYNCIVAGNKGYQRGGSNYNPIYGNENIATQSGTINVYSSLFNSIPTGNYSGVRFNFDEKSFNYIGKEDGQIVDWTDIFENVNTTDFSQSNYRLKGYFTTVNMGMNEIEENNVNLFDYTDMDFTDRIKDCTVDAGAYERNNEDNIDPDETTNGKAIYYVTQTGLGNASGDSPANAACAMKLQQVLTAAGEYAASNTGTEVIVKVAGYQNASFTYHVNTLADENNPQSYSYVIPYGVTVMGGYNEGTAADGSGGNWDDDNRNASEYMTVFSAIKEATSTTQEVNGYHVVTFGEKPADWPVDNNKTSIIDGVYLENGSATSLAGSGSDDTRGGAAIVPAWAHVRNCVIRYNSAIQGGGLYVLPGGMVSGCAIMNNTAEDEGGGIYAANTYKDSDGKDVEVAAETRAHLISNTVVENTASDGGGLYIEDGAAMTINSVVWGNTAGSDKNVSGTLNRTYEDELLTTIVGGTGEGSVTDWYPFNNCYVESIEIPGNFDNNSMESIEETYFGQYFTLKPYSILINNGMVETVQQYLIENKGVAAYDMQGNKRIDSDVASGEVKIDVGAFAFTGGQLSTDKLVKRLFVSKGSTAVLASGANVDDYTGKSFFTPLTDLDDALDYIEKVRENIESAKSDTFEILIAEGTYKPKYRRHDAATTEIDQRQNSFDVPYNVNIYGGFTGEENYTSDGITSIPTEDGNITDLKPDGDIGEILANRTRSDFNQNNIYEPWEMKEQTVLSGYINLSSTEQKVYHIVYSDKDTSTGAPETQSVVLDGLTIMDSKTKDNLSDIASNNEIGRGGGVYSNGVDYTIVNCHFTGNQAVRGGAVFLRDANLNIINSMLAGNSTIKNEAGNLSSSGGAVFVTSASATGTASLNAVNTLWANNTSVGEGGAIASDVAEPGSVTANTTKINLMNNTFVRNKADENAVLHHTGGTDGTNLDILVNTLLWGNVSTKKTGHYVEMTYSASDTDYEDHPLFDGSITSNVKLSSDNLAIDGPRFAHPTSDAGADYNDAKSQWNPIAVSLLTDKGNGKMNANGSDYEGDDQAYRDWFKTPDFTKYVQGYANAYIMNVPKEEEVVKNSYERYSGPNKADGTRDVRPIDIGVYEYQYRQDFSTMDRIYVATQSSGSGNGSDWANATDDLRGAIIGAANPTSTENKRRRVYVRDGEYASLTDINTAFPLSVGGQLDFVDSVTIVGSCTGVGLGDLVEQDFSNATVIRNYQGVNAPKNLMAVSTQGKQVTLSGITFINGGGDGLEITNVGSGGSFTLKNSALRANAGDGVVIQENSGKALFANVLFADNGTNETDGTAYYGLNVGASEAGNTTLVNTTFANNATDMSEGIDNVYNSTSWNNDVQNMQETDGYNNYNNNKVFDSNTDNADISNGPNFRDPQNADIEKRDYRIRPSLTLLNNGDNGLYARNVLGKTAGDVSIPDTEKDLYNASRVTDETIDIGAYEYGVELKQVIYVKSGLAGGSGDGTSWEDAMDDLQGAADLAGIYSHERNDYAYVFVHNNVKESGNLNVSLSGAKIYGGMNDERSDVEDDVSALVEELLAQRAGLIEREASSRSQLNGSLNISARSVIDGFEINNDVVLNGDGMLSTSVIRSDGKVSGSGGNNPGILYNTLVEGSVSGVKAVNVTATGTIDETIDGSGNNREAVTEKNPYVTDGDWEYQLVETSTDIDGKTENVARVENIGYYMDFAGHERDMAGNKRVRNGYVDNGCFETWNITAGMTEDNDNVVTEDDYPHGKSVVYVRHNSYDNTEGDDGAELQVTKDYTTSSPFNPGFLLLEHRAGLRANNNAVSLTNFAVERNLDDAGTSMAVMPFAVTRMEPETGVVLKLYDAKERAKYDYKFEGTDSKAWKDTQYNDASRQMTIGWMLDGGSGNKGTKVRFYGSSYEETPGSVMDVVLVKNNFIDPWDSNNNSGDKFTHKENMSWNLFGSPYLCAMNYADMEYGRVIYPYDKGMYAGAINTDGMTEGYIPACDAVFTQTATLKSDGEQFEVSAPSANGKIGTIYQAGTTTAVAIAQKAGMRAADATDADRIRLNAVPAKMSKTDFDISSDGVKWMSDNSIPQIYAIRNGGRYSLLSAVNVEGSVAVGVALPEAGMYTLSVPEDCDVSDYESVILTDAKTGRQTNLLEGGYDFTSVEGGDIEGRFSISFNRMVEDADGNIRIWNDGRGEVCVEGLENGDVANIYSSDGRRVAARTATSSSTRIVSPVTGPVIVDVVRDGRRVTVRKITVK